MNRIALVIGVVLLMIGCAHISTEQESKEDVAIADTTKSLAVLVQSGMTKIDTSIIYTRYSDYGLVEDLNGDNFPELVTLVANSKTNEIGLRIIDGKDRGNVTMFGAGNEINGMKNLRWIKLMKAVPKGFFIAPTNIDSLTGDVLGIDSIRGIFLRNIAVQVAPQESHSSAIVYWNGTDYSWMHQEF